MARKLEILYDKLRAHEVSVMLGSERVGVGRVSLTLFLLWLVMGHDLLQLNEATVHGLHNIAHYIKAYDYVTALGTVNSLVNSGSFATLSEFLPGVKVLLQVAKQLEVYLETSQY